MIVVKITGGLGQQLSQFAFGMACAKRLHSVLKLDSRACPLFERGLAQFTLECDLATDDEVSQAMANGLLQESGSKYDPQLWNAIRDGIYIDGQWQDPSYCFHAISTLKNSLQAIRPLSGPTESWLSTIRQHASVALYLNINSDNAGVATATLPPDFYRDALQEIMRNSPYAHVYIFTANVEKARTAIQVTTAHTWIETGSDAAPAEAFELQRACQHHIPGDHLESIWAAVLGQNKGQIILAQTRAVIPPSLWEPNWISLPVRKPKPADLDFATILGGHSLRHPMRIGLLNYYEELTTQGFIFKNTNASIGHDLLRPWVDLYRYGQLHGIDFVTPDQVDSLEQLDAIVFVDRPRIDSAMARQLMARDIPKYLCICEPEVVKLDNWDKGYHRLFTRVFTWNDDLVDDKRYIKLNFAIQPDTEFDTEGQSNAFYQRKLCTMIAGAKTSSHPNELYSRRVQTIRWFENNEPGDFDLYGMGWPPALFPSYRGPVADKLITLARYRFAICYENADNSPGYISEKILDCFRAGIVPVYWGAPNISNHIPPDCYIDRKAFATEDALYSHLKSMDFATHAAYLERINSLMNSAAIYPFSIECFITTLTSFIAKDIVTARSECPLLSVVIPAYNYGNYLGMAIQSALSQDVPTLEVLVCDNASTDQTRRIVTEQFQHPQLRYVCHSRNIGGPRNWRVALQNATGRYVTILSADDYFLPDHLPRMVKCLDESPQVAVAYCPCLWIDESGNALGVADHAGHPATDALGKRNEIAHLFAFDSFITPSAAVIRRSVLEQVGAIDISFHGAIDWDLWIRIARLYPDFAFFKKPGVGYRKHGAQDTERLNKSALLLVDHIVLLERAQKNGLFPELAPLAMQAAILLQHKFNSYPREIVTDLASRVASLTQSLLAISANGPPTTENVVQGSGASPTLLAINVVACDRSDIFTEIILTLEKEMNALLPEFRHQIEININDDPSGLTSERSTLCASIAQRSGIRLNFNINQDTSGIDRKVQACCELNPQADFTWVLADIRHIIPGCLPRILNLLLEHRSTLGLMILSDGKLQRNSELSNKIFPSFLHYATLAVKSQPDFMSTGAVISNALFKTSIFDMHEAIYAAESLAVRIGASPTFSAARGIAKGLLRENGSKLHVLTPDFVCTGAVEDDGDVPILDANTKPDAERARYFYILWLLSEIGIPASSLQI